MKTVSELIKEIFAVRNEERRRHREERERLCSKENPENENQEINEKPKQENYERENHEVDGNSGMADPDNQKADRVAENSFQPESGDPGKSGESGTVETAITREDLQAAIEKAYREGEIAGRNAVIEERYFPSENDGIPQFRGRQNKPSSSTDIFSMAREA